MEQKINYEVEVKRKYKKAKCYAAEFGYVVLNTFMCALSFEKETPELAWQDAYTRILNSQKKKNNE